MFSHVAYYLVIFGVPLMHNLLFPVKGQCTVQGCETGDSSISIASEIRQMFAEFHERLQAIDRRSQDQVQSIHQLLNASVQQTSSFNESLKRLQYQQDTIMTSLQSVTVGQHAQRQDVCVKEVHELLNTSNQQMTNQHTSILRRLDEVMELLLDHDIYTKNQSQNLWTPTTEATLRPTPVTDFENDSTLLQHSTLLPSLNNWTIIMNRFNGSLNFKRNWIEYRNGFGDIGRGEFWLGNEIVHRLTNRSGLTYSLRVEVQLRATGVWYHADYASFSLDSESNKYTLRLSGFSGGDAGDSLTNSSVPSYAYHGGMKFTTWDADNDRWSDGNSASLLQGGWWFHSGYYACLTCQYNSHFRLVGLSHLSSGGYLRAARMMIKSR